MHPLIKWLKGRSAEVALASLLVLASPVTAAENREGDAAKQETERVQEQVREYYRGQAGEASKRAEEVDRDATKYYEKQAEETQKHTEERKRETETYYEEQERIEREN